MQRKRATSGLLLSVLAISLFFLINCAPQPKTVPPALDRPENHVFSGIKLLDKGEYEGAKRQFNLALQRNSEFSPAYSGLSLVHGYEGNFGAAFATASKAKKWAKTRGENVNVRVGLIRICAMERKGDWLDAAERNFEKAVEVDSKSSDAYYYMGEAYEFAYDFDKAGAMFKEVLDINDRYLAEADYHLERVQKVQRAAPGSVIGKRTALKDKVTRADLAALLIQELELEKIDGKPTPKRCNAGYGPMSATTVFPSNGSMKNGEAKDIIEHALKSDIQAVLDIRVNGLGSYPDHTFRPEKPISRGSFAMVIEDILIKSSGDDKLATKFIGTTCPFPDLTADLPYFNAVMVVTIRGIMAARDLATGEFAPMEPVSGADALLVVRKLKDELRFFRRSALTPSLAR